MFCRFMEQMKRMLAVFSSLFFAYFKDENSHFLLFSPFYYFILLYFVLASFLPTWFEWIIVLVLSVSFVLCCSNFDGEAGLSRIYYNDCLHLFFSWPWWWSSLNLFLQNGAWYKIGIRNGLAEFSMEGGGSKRILGQWHQGNERVI